jgi:hypothetical protein
MSLPVLQGRTKKWGCGIFGFCTLSETLTRYEILTELEEGLMLSKQKGKIHVQQNTIFNYEY